MRMQGKQFLTLGILFATSTTLIAQTVTPKNHDYVLPLAVTITGQNTNFPQGSSTLTSIVPDNAKQGESLVVTITGQNTNFLQGSSTGVTGVWFSQGSPTVNIFASSYSAFSDTSVNANFDIPVDAVLGLWDVHVSDDIDGMLTLPNGFTVMYKISPVVSFLDKAYPSHQVIGVAADGASEVVIQITALPEDITLDDIQISLTGGAIDGSLEDDKKISSGVFTQTYVVPACFYPVALTEKERTVELIVTVKGEQIDHEPFTLIRPPVVMVHGLWGQLRDFNDLRIKLEQNGWEKDFLCRVRYNNANSFRDLTNIQTLSNNITNTISIVRSEGYAVRKVDVVAHSMGGLLAKNLPAGFAQGTVRKIITIGTPYLGSPLADRLYNFLTTNPILALDVEIPLNKLFYTTSAISGGAIADLRTNNITTPTQISGVDCQDILVGLRNGSPLPLPFVAIVKLATQKSTLEDAHNIIFGQGVTSDWIVSTGSQRGDAGFWYERQVAWHCSEPQDPNIISLVTDWLNEPAQPKFAENLTTEKQPTSLLTGNASLDKTPIQNEAEPNGTVEIITPIEGQACTAGENIAVSIQGTGDTTQTAVFAFFGSSSWADIVQLPWEGDVNVPSDSVGSAAEIIAIGLDPNMNVTDQDEVNLAMNSNIVLQEIFFGFGNTWYFDFKTFPQQSQELQLYPMGIFSDGSEYPLSVLGSQTNYQSLNECVATVDSNGMITVHSKGQASIVVTNSSITTTVLIEIDTYSGDLDIDGDVDFVDYAIFANHWMERDCTADNNWCEYTDLNKSGQVDAADLRIFAECWLEGTSP